MKNSTLKASIFALLLSSEIAFSQNSSDTELYNMSLEELMNIPINSASKKDETLFDAPLSSYTITRSDIDKAGVTSIPEALRLAPGLIVREQTNGNYDIHIRGFDNLLRYSETYTKSNLTTLVMIDNRPVFNHNAGGVLWETLPIDLSDVERIEIVRGPAAPLFGPNAVTGVINIITKRAQDTALADASVQYGSANTLITNGSVGKNIGEKFSFTLSGNYQSRERFDQKYYLIPTRMFVTPSELSEKTNLLFPNPERALQKWGANAFMHYQPVQRMSFDLSIGVQESDVQRVFIGTYRTTYLVANRSRTQYANLAADVYGVHIRSSWVNGYDNLNVIQVANQYDYTTADFNAEYGIKLAKKYTLTPGISYQQVTYSDLKYTIEKSNTAGFLNATQSLSTLAGFVRSDLNPTDHWRFMVAVRADKFSTPDQVRLSYELATTYKINTRHLLRAALTQSNNGSFVANNYININIEQMGLNIYQKGNQNLDLLTVRMYEIGYRAQLSKALQLDMDLFHQTASNMTASLITEFAPTPPYPPFTPQAAQFNNIPTRATQIGATLSLNYVPNEKIQFKPFITIQNTQTRNLPSLFIDPALAQFINPALAPSQSYISDTHRNTPSVYGGYFLQVRASKKLDVNLNGYYFSDHNQYDLFDPEGSSEQGQIKRKLLFNAKVNYRLTSQLNLFVSSRNGLGNRSREFFGADQAGALYLAGAAFRLK